VPETYVHRIGRTARAGADGVAISLIAGAEEMGYLRDIERLIRVALPREDRRTPGSRDAAPPPSQNRGARSAPPAIPTAMGMGMATAPMTPRPDQKALAATAVVVVIMRRRSRPGMSRRVRCRVATARAFKASPSCIARAAEYPTQP